VREVTDAFAMPTTADFDPFGVRTSNSATPFGFTGEHTLQGNSIVYLRARSYMPHLGVFMSLDPLETANRYAYVGGNVVNRVDPSGLQAEGIGSVCLGLVLVDGALPGGDAICIALIATLGIAGFVNWLTAAGQIPAPTLPEVYPPGNVPGITPVPHPTLPGFPPPAIPDNGGSRPPVVTPVRPPQPAPNTGPTPTATPQPIPPLPLGEPQPTGAPTPQPTPQPSPQPTGTCTPTPTATPKRCESKVYRVQGGTPPNSSQEYLEIGSNGGMNIRRDLMQSFNTNRLWVTFDNPDRALEYLLTNRPGGYIIGFDIETNFVHHVFAAGRFEHQKQHYPREVWARTPIIGDANLSYIVNSDGERFYSSYGLPEPWITGMEAAVCDGTGFVIR
jgi:RHS repeat-associated protein